MFIPVRNWCDLRVGPSHDYLTIQIKQIKYCMLHAKENPAFSSLYPVAYKKKVLLSQTRTIPSATKFICHVVELAQTKDCLPFSWLSKPRAWMDPERHPDTLVPKVQEGDVGDLLASVGQPSRVSENADKMRRLRRTKID